MAEQEIAVFGGGCFWCTEAVFRMLRGVLDVKSGYAGGRQANPSYEKVSMGGTGHAEVIQITFDPTQILFSDLLTVFFASHDPTTLNRQGADVGTQYRSTILYTNDAQKAAAETYIAELNASGEYSNPIVTTVEPFDAFYEAESYHQDYYKKNSDQPYCEVVIDPKVKKVKEKFAELLKRQDEH